MTNLSDTLSEAAEPAEMAITQGEESDVTMQCETSEMMMEDDESEVANTADEDSRPAVAEENLEAPREPSPFPWEDGSAS